MPFLGELRRSSGVQYESIYHLTVVSLRVLAMCSKEKHRDLKAAWLPMFNSARYVLAVTCLII